MATRLISPVTIFEADPYMVYAEAIKMLDIALKSLMAFQRKNLHLDACGNHSTPHS